MTCSNKDVPSDSDPSRTLVLPVDGNSILLGRKKKYNNKPFCVNKYAGFGGKIGQKESVKQAAIRECKEKCGIIVTKMTKVAIINFMDDYDTIANVHAFIATEWDGEPIETKDVAPHWFDKRNIPYEKMWDIDIYWLPAVLSGKKLQADFKFHSTDETIIDISNSIKHVAFEIVNKLK